MKVEDQNDFIWGLGVSAFDRLGLEDWLPNYRVLCLGKAEWTKKFPSLRNKVFELDEILPNVVWPKLNTTTALDILDWKWLSKKMDIKKLLTYKPTKNQEDFEDKNGIQILNNRFSLFEQLENKVNFRNFMNEPDLFPKYQVVSIERLFNLSFANIFQTLGKFVLQDERLSGGRGTFIVSTSQEYESARTHLINIKSKKIVISEFITGKPASMQVCITKYGIFTLPLQRQIISQPDLINTSLPGADSFNGGQWAKDDFSKEENEQAKTYAVLIGDKIQKKGYRGIFGIDFIVAEKGIFVIEVNARLTGMTPVIASMQKSMNQIPLLLLHTLEQAEINYHLNEQEIEKIKNYTWGRREYGYLIVFNNSLNNREITQTLEPGIYRNNNGAIKFESYSYALNDLKREDYLLLDFPNKDKCILPNNRLGRVLTPQRVLDEQGNLTDAIKDVVKYIRLKTGEN
jgi:glutathione synthase/RimK-type ligase-like ATP-grasp enzyme